MKKIQRSYTVDRKIFKEFQNNLNKTGGKVSTMIEIFMKKYNEGVR